MDEFNLQKQAELLLKNAITLVIDNVVSNKDVLARFDIKNLAEFQIMAIIDEFVIKKIIIPHVFSPTREMMINIEESLTYTLTYYLKVKFLDKKVPNMINLMKIFISRLGADFLYKILKLNQLFGDENDENNRIHELRSTHDGDIKHASDFTMVRKVPKHPALEN